MTGAVPPVEVPAGQVEEFPAGTVRLVVASGRRVAVGNAEHAHQDRQRDRESAG